MCLPEYINPAYKEIQEDIVMSNRLFQSVIHQMKDSFNRTIGVIDETGTIIACSELSKIGEVIDAVAETIKEDEDLEIYTSGTNNIFKYPELADNQRASELINTFEEKQLLSQLIDDSEQTESGHGIKVYIGEEAPIQTMKDCSIVTANYEFGEGMKGTIGIIGPKRMDYEKVVGTLKTIKVQLDALYQQDDKKKLP